MVGAPHIPRTAHAAASTSTFQSFPSHAIAIVGAACRLPGANSLDDLWEIISQGQTRLEKLRTDRVPLRNSYRAWQDPKWVTEREFYGNFIDDVDAFDHAFFGISPREAKYMDPQQRLLLETAFEAMDSSGYLRYHERERGDPVGCFLGASYTEYLENTSAYSPTAFTATGTIRAFLSGRISYHFGWTGPSEVIDTACSASIVAIHRACQAIIAGECPIALAGGVNIITGVHNYFDLGKATFLSKTGQCKPFDDSGDGYCRADGVGLVVLKPLKQAVLDGDNIMGVIPAVATNQGGIGAPGITVPDGIAQRALYRRLLEKSGLQPDDITYVEAHGTGTQAGDPVEMGSIREVFGGPKRSSTLYIGSLKANIGHCETAAGVASLLKVLTMFRNRGIPPLQGFKRLNHKIPALEPHKIHIPTELLPWDTVSGRRVTCVSSFGASGSNSALLCSEWLEESGSIKPNDSMDQPMQEFPVLLSAASPESLHRYVNGLADYISKHESAGTLTIGNLSFTLSQRRKHHRVRWSTATSRLADLVDKLRSCTPQDFVQAPKAAKKVVLVFSGQSKTTIGLSPSALQENPRFKHHIQTCNDILKRLGCPDIVPALSQVEPIADPAILQCGTVAVQYACAQCFLDAGLNVDAIVGHSLGELAALAVSGALSLADALKVVYARAELIKAKWGSEGGTMMAIHADEETVRSIMEIANSTLDYDHDKLEIACHNSATSHVVVGKQTSIALAENTIQQDARYRGIKYQRLNVSHGFHSRFTEPLLQDLVHVGSTVEWKEPAIALETSTKSPVAFSNKTSTRSYIADHARKPVYFVDAVRRVEQRLGPCIWLEAGWNTPIVAMAKRAVANPAIHAFHPVVSPAAAVAKLWLEDIPVAHWDFFAPQKSGLKHIWLPAYSFDRPKFWLEYVDRAIEEQKAAQSMKQANPVTPNCTTTQPLVSYRGSTGSSHQFCLHTTTERYTRIVQGHAVLQKPLCPASMYMEAAIMAMQQLGASAKGKTITFENVVFTKPLGCDDSIDVQLTLDRASTRTSEDAWHYSVRSSSNPKVAHSEGDFSVNTSDSENTDLQLYEMLVGNQMAALQNDPNAERLKTATAYALFSRVVEYADILRGMSTITLGAKQAVAQVRVPKTSFSASESSVADFYDAITTDCFIQVLGLLINCNSGSSADGEIYVASKIGKMVVSPTEFQTPQTWTVYAMFSPLDAKTSSGAVYVFSGDGKLTSYATNIQFVRIQAARLEHALESANRKVSASTPIRPGLIHNNASPAVSLVKDVARPQHSTPATPIPPPLDNATTLSSASDNGADRPQGNAAADLKSLISVYTGVPVEEMEANQNLSSMGLDSLASMELAEEIESKLGFKVGTDDILLGTVGSLLKLCSLANAEPVSDSCSESSDSTRDSAGESNTPGTTPGTTPEIETPAEQDLKLNSAHAIDRSVPWLRPNGASSSRHRGIDTVVYKEVDGVEILADLYIPMETPPQPMPVGMDS
jgi:acyl transferase domain-containing protein